MVGPVGLEPTTYGLKEVPIPVQNVGDPPFRAWFVDAGWHWWTAFSTLVCHKCAIDLQPARPADHWNLTRSSTSARSTIRLEIGARDPARWRKSVRGRFAAYFSAMPRSLPTRRWQAHRSSGPLQGSAGVFREVHRWSVPLCPELHAAQPWWWLSTRWRYPSPLDGVSQGWCCGTSLRYGCYGIPDADSGAPCGQQVFGAHNDVGAGARGKPAGADRE